MSRGNREWCFVVNNWTQTDYEQVFNLKNEARYLVFGKEIGEKCGTPHLQGYVYFKDCKTLSRMKKYIPRANFGIRYEDSTPEQASAYCKKDKEYLEFGQISKQGKRVDLDEIKDDIVAGKDVDEILLENPVIYHQYGRTLEKIQDVTLRRQTRTEFTKGYWIFGVSGGGKSELLFNNYSSKRAYVWKKEKEWQDGYKQQPLVIIDEFRGQLPFWKLLELADKWTNCWVERRGKEAMPFTSKAVCISSALRPEEVFKNLDANDKWLQFNRRYRVVDISNIRAKLILELELKFL